MFVLIHIFLDGTELQRICSYILETPAYDIMSSKNAAGLSMLIEICYLF